MTSIDQAFWDDVFADIVYVDGFTLGMTGDDLRDQIRYRVPLSLAQEIGVRFQVIAVRDDPASEYQGVVFKDRTDGTLYVANRGTAGGKDIVGSAKADRGDPAPCSPPENQARVERIF